MNEPMSQEDFELACAECEGVKVSTIKAWRKSTVGYSNEKIDDMYLGYSLATVALEKQKAITRRVSAESNRLFDEKAVLIKQLEAAERERDELGERFDKLASAIGWSREQCEQTGDSPFDAANTLMSAKEELARRDDAAGEPVAYTSQANLDAVALKQRKQLEFMTGDKGIYRNPISLYTAAQPAVLPWYVDSCSNCGSKCLSWDTTVIKNTAVQDGILKLNETSGLFYLGCDECSETLMKVSADDVANHLNNAKVLGSQPQRPVVLPALFNLKMAGDVKTKQYFKGSNDTIKQIAGLLDSANVPYEVKK